MSVAFLAAAGLLALERACYVWIARAPRSFRRWCARPAVGWLGEPITVVRSVLTIWGFFLAARSPHEDWFLLAAHPTHRPIARS